MKKTEVKYYLEKRKDKVTGKLVSKNVPILLFYSFSGQRLQYFTGLRIDAFKWDEENMRVKKGFEEASEINMELKRLGSIIDTAIEKARVLQESVTIEQLRDTLKGKISLSKDKKTFRECFDEFMESSTLIKSEGTMRALRSSKNHIFDFEKNTGIRLDFGAIDQEFYDKFLNYCFNNRGLKNAYTGKLIKDLKAFLNWATDRGYNKNLEFRKKYFKKLTEDIEIIFLTYQELLKLHKKKLKDSKHDEIRDLFCFGCFTGMRLSDILALSPENIQDDKILFRVEKTEQSNMVPLNPYSKALLKKYEGKFPNKCLPSYSEGFINRILKDLFKETELDRKVQSIHFQGAKKFKETHPLHKIVTFHISKKTFMTNFLAKGGSLTTAMAITGNKDFKTAKRYFKVVDTLKADEMAKVFGK